MEPTANDGQTTDPTTPAPADNPGGMPSVPPTPPAGGSDWGSSQPAPGGDTPPAEGAPTEAPGTDAPMPPAGA